MDRFLKMQKILPVILFCSLAFAQCTGSAESQLRKIADDANKKGPVMLDQWTRLDSSVVYPNLTIRYYHTINEVVISDTTKFKTQLKPQIVKNVKTRPDMEFFRDNGVTMVYIYRDKDGKYIFSEVIAPQEYKQ